jgi:hypothetical protein
MKKLLFCLSVILGIALNSYSQTTTPKEVVIPTYILDSIVQELIIKDHLVYTVNLQDSTIQVYKKDHKNDLEKIQILAIKNTEYEGIVKKLEELSLYDKAELKDCKKEVKVGKFKSFIKGTAIGGVIVVILFIAL